MPEFQTRSYTFNHPLAALLMVPLILIEVLLAIGLGNEFNFVAALMLVITAMLILVIAGYGFFRTIRISHHDVQLSGLSKKITLSKQEIKRFGVVKYRAFRFIYVSKSDSGPFNPEQPNISPTPETIVFQYRKGAWDNLNKWFEGKSDATREDFHFRN